MSPGLVGTANSGGSFAAGGTSGNAGVSTAGDSFATAGGRGGGGAGLSGQGGRFSSGGSSGGKPGFGGGGYGTAASAGMGGAGGLGACGDTQVLFVIQRSGAMLEPGNWANVHDVIVGTYGFSGELARYWGELEVGALFFARVQIDDSVECPSLDGLAPMLDAWVPLASLLDSNLQKSRAAIDAHAQLNAPVAEAVAAGASMLTGGNRHLILITAGAPDTCLQTDDACAVDASIKAVQDARELGISTHVIGVGTTDRLNATGDDHGYETYLTQLANAGAGQPVTISPVFAAQCAAAAATATYAAQANGDARAYHTATWDEFDAAVAEILKSICPLGPLD